MIKLVLKPLHISCYTYTLSAPIGHSTGRTMEMIGRGNLTLHSLSSMGRDK